MNDLDKFEAWFLAEVRAGRLYGADREGALPAWQASRSSALEEAQKACDEIAADCWSLYKGRPPYTGSEAGRADPYVQGESDGAEKYAAAIRELET